MDGRTSEVTHRFFQSTPPRRRRLIIGLGSFNNAFFNPRLREGGDVSRTPRVFHSHKSFSIHASAKEATL